MQAGGISVTTVVVNYEVDVSCHLHPHTNEKGSFLFRCFQLHMWQKPLGQLVLSEDESFDMCSFCGVRHESVGSHLSHPNLHVETGSEEVWGSLDGSTITQRFTTLANNSSRNFRTVEDVVHIVVLQATSAREVHSHLPTIVELSLDLDSIRVRRVGPAILIPHGLQEKRGRGLH